jgi:hypothetical protein
MYHLYHIPDRKEWGCTKYLENRVKKLGYKMSNVDRIITVGNIDKAADMEKQLNLEYLYGWNESQDYRRVKKMATLGGFKTGKQNGLKNKQSGHMAKIAIMGGNVMGKIQGKINAESGHMSLLGKLNCSKIHTCPYCGKVGKSSSMFQWHFDKCKYKIVK